MDIHLLYMKLPASGRKPLDLYDYDVLVVIDSNQMYILHIDVYIPYICWLSHVIPFLLLAQWISQDLWMYETIGMALTSISFHRAT